MTFGGMIRVLLAIRLSANPANLTQCFLYVERDIAILLVSSEMIEYELLLQRSMTLHGSRTLSRA